MLVRGAAGIPEMSLFQEQNMHVCTEFMDSLPTDMYVCRLSHGLVHGTPAIRDTTSVRRAAQRHTHGLVHGTPAIRGTTSVRRAAQRHTHGLVHGTPAIRDTTSVRKLPSVVSCVRLPCRTSSGSMGSSIASDCKPARAQRACKPMTVSATPQRVQA